MTTSPPRCPPSWAAKALAAALLCAAARGARAQQAQPQAPQPAPPPAVDVFAPDNRVFQALLADPREIQLSASYYRLNGQDDADVALGHSWGMTRWNLKDGWKLQWDIEGMAYSRFGLSGAVNDFDTVDFIGRLPLDFRKDDFSGRVMIFHESSHLGDDYIRATGDLGSRYSIDGVRGQLSEQVRALRLYVGGTYLLETVPAPQRGAVQAGCELTSAPYHWLRGHPATLFLAQDVQSNENAAWNVNSNSVVGVRVLQDGTTRAIRFQLGYFDGHSPYGQFYLTKEHYANVAIVFEL